MLGRKLKKHLLIVVLLAITKLVSSAPKSWPYMKNYDIWGSNNTIEEKPQKFRALYSDSKLENVAVGSVRLKNERRKAKVIDFFSPFSVDDECLSDDGRRIGLCMNVYECRIKGGLSRGDCALGFGVCCVFETTCDGEVSNNITYFVSPKFPALMPFERENCSLKIRLVSDDISQIRLDFHHFTLGQPNRATGICENDIFSLVGGSFPFILCGQNSGQHIFYDVVSPKARANQELAININLNRRSVSSRLWEIRIVQVPFGARSPAGCLQYFTGDEGIIQTFNFAENGRHLANQDYRSCIRQEPRRCSIQYEPCNDNSFRIGPMRDQNGGLPGSMMPSDGTPANDEGAVAQDEIQNEIDMNQMNEEMPGEGDQQAEETQNDEQQEEQQQDEEQQADEEGSGGDDGGVSFFPAFTFPSFFRSFSARQSRQLYSPCTDRITIPCIVEDFIGAGMGNVQTCIPVLCGTSLCRNGNAGCKLETSVTPFHVGVHFGDGKSNKGSPEDNIGMCLRYKQLPCV